MKLAFFVVVAVLATTAFADPIIKEVGPGQDFGSWIKENFNTTFEALFPVAPNDAENAFVYTYRQTSGHFSGPAYDGGQISTTGCSGKAGSCRNNPACQCKKSVGPLPRGTYRLSAEMVFKGMAHCYVLTQTSGDACGRSGFLIHGGNCAGDPSEGCIVINNPATRQKIKGGGTLKVIQ